MTVRCLAALILAASLLNLNVARADIGCAKHDPAGGSDHGTPDHAMTHEGTMEQAQSRSAGAQLAANDRPCETPVQPQCCQALASCSPVFGADAESAIHRYVPSHDITVAAAIEIPLSLVATPDPPPPKA